MPTKAQTLSGIKRKTATPRRENRRSAASRGYGYRWMKARKLFLSINPLCVLCKLENIIKAARVVDHIIPHKGDMAKFWDRSNWQSLCTAHHNTKTATEDGGFGHKIKETL
jgi:5-methylcytosine-specific restriction protein A